MILQYLKKKENKEQIIAYHQYEKILSERKEGARIASPLPIKQPYLIR